MQALRIHIDEAGRGPLAGPVFVGCMMSLQNFTKDHFQDSKILNAKQREYLYERIYMHEKKGECIAATGYTHNTYIDTHGIIKALQYASQQAIFHLLKKFFYMHRQKDLLNSVHGEDHIAAHQLAYIFAHARGGKEALRTILHIPNSIATVKTLIIDGNHHFGLEELLGIRVVTIIKGDSKHPLIAAASIAAKVERDMYMHHIQKKYPNYNFKKHKGYGTAEHRKTIAQLGYSPIHRKSFCTNILAPKTTNTKKIPQPSTPINQHIIEKQKNISTEKPKLLLHICCAPDLSWPLHWLKEHFKLYLFRYNPNIHPRKEHSKRYDAFIKLIGLEQGDYEIVEDRYDPREFFAAMIEQKEDIDPKLKHASKKAVLAQAGEMEERSSRCNPCYSMRLAEAAKNAAKYDIPYFTSTLLISPKKKMDKLFRRGKEGERRYPSTKFLWFDFAKNGGYDKASKLTKKHNLYRQNYCGCGRTIPKPGEENKEYRGG